MFSRMYSSSPTKHEPSTLYFWGGRRVSSMNDEPHRLAHLCWFSFSVVVLLQVRDSFRRSWLRGGALGRNQSAGEVVLAKASTKDNLQTAQKEFRAFALNGTCRTCALLNVQSLSQLFKYQLVDAGNSRNRLRLVHPSVRVRVGESPAPD